MFMKARRSTKSQKAQLHSNDAPSTLAFPFTAIVGQDEMKLALVLNAIDPLIGGVLITGHRGTGKSTAVRALADLLPEIQTVEGCHYGCAPDQQTTQCLECRVKTSRGLKVVLRKTPVVELPLGATEDRVCGSISIERALLDGVKSFEPGLLARANRGFLYVDEVNLLEDHLVDMLLDVATTGWNKVEREGISIEHPAKFVLIGSGNPEEGELRPQLLDRFGVSVAITTEDEVYTRVEIIRRRDSYDRDPLSFTAAFASQQLQLQKKIITARELFATVEVPSGMLTQIARMCIDLHVDGHRGELTIMRAARALAAFEGRPQVEDQDIRRVAPMSLRHRMRRNAMDETASEDQIERAVENVLNNSTAEADDEINESSDNGGAFESSSPQSSSTSPPARTNFEPTSASTIVFEPNLTGNRSSDAKTSRRSAGGKRKVLNASRGRHVTSVASKQADSQIALPATVRAMFTSRDPEPLRYKLYARKRGTLFIFVIDCSGSMARNRIAVAKRVILQRLQKSYVNRDGVAIISFRGDTAHVDLPPTRSIIRARRALDSLPVGGSTPLPAALQCTVDLIRTTGNRHGDIAALLFTDGNGNVPLNNSKTVPRGAAVSKEVKLLAAELRALHLALVVVDTKREYESSDQTRLLAELLGADWVRVKLSS